MFEVQKGTTPWFVRSSVPNKLKENPEKWWRIRTGGWTVRFSSGSQHHGPNLHSEANLRKIFEYDKDLFACFVALEKA